MNYKTALEKLFSLHQFGIKLGLDNTINLLKHIGNPEKNLKCFHIAGSNGKGSTSSFIASILTEAGYKTGLYTSPHLIKFNERIRINEVMIDDDYVVEFMNNVTSYIEKNEVTFFELTTAMAFKYFYDMEVDYCVIEAGLGGRLDSTNVINPLISIITTISLEHTNILGHSIEEIAAEKGGIIKRGVPIITGLLLEEATDVLKEKAKNQAAPFYQLKDYIIQKENSVSLLFNEQINLYSLPLKGYHQFINASLAISVIKLVMENIPNEKIFKGIKNVICNSGIQGRFEIYSKSPLIIFDSAHNIEGIESFINEYKKFNITKGDSKIIFAVMKDKNYKVMLEMLKEYFGYFYFSTIDYERAEEPIKLNEVAESLSIDSEVSFEAEKIIKNQRIKGNDVLVVLGSIYFLGEIKSKLLDVSS
ncbi:MAG: bifunctional folylpolyglutamate synthase/dihydrofolate synthase [Melioribacteraceae bacterium]|nr:bifunctional folylpolyglutamate synthase/dihydrofolate synthase [Melioribacteraceae bacterium]